MKNPLKRKQCKQCGWELKPFSRQDFCRVECASLYDKNKREYEEWNNVKSNKTNV